MIPHTRFAAPLVAATLLFAACSGDGGSAGSSPTRAPDTTLSSTTVVAPSTTSPATTTTEPTVTYAATIDELLAIGRPIVLAHTAGEDEFPASTLYAFGESVKAGVDMLDLNVNLTKDGELVVQHDDSVDRNTNGTGKVADLTMDEIAALDAAYWFATECADCHDRAPGDYLYRGIRTGEKEPPAGYTADDFALPTLRQLVARFPDIPLNIEIKGEGDVAKRTADVLAAQLKELGRSEATVVASFSDEIVSYYHSIDPDTEVSPGLGALAAYVTAGTPIPDGMKILQVPPEYGGLRLTPELAAKAIGEGYILWIWPNNRALENQASYEDFLALGVQGLNINFPAQGVAAVQAYLAATGVEAAASAGCDTESPAAPGQYDAAFSAAGLDGTSSTYLPASYDGATPMPLVLGLHGWLQTPPLLAAESDLPARGERYGFVSVLPDITRTVPHWDTATDSADVEWIAALLDDVEATRCIDTNRVYVTGMSNGAMMTSTLSCALADRFAAAAPVAGVTDPPDCGTPTAAVPVVAFHGTADPYLSYTGGLGEKALELPAADGNGTIGDMAAGDTTGLSVGLEAPVPDRVAAWAGRNGCDGEPSDTDPTDDVVVSDWAGCDSGTTRLFTVNDGGHTWPGSTFDTAIPDTLGATTTTIDATDVMWRFFVLHPRSG